MAKLEARATIEASISLVLTEKEARALRMLTEFNPEDIIVALDKVLDTLNLQKHGPGLRSFFESINNPLTQELHRLDKAREAMTR